MVLGIPVVSLGRKATNDSCAERVWLLSHSLHDLGLLESSDTLIPGDIRILRISNFEKEEEEKEVEVEVYRPGKSCKKCADNSVE